MVHSVGPSEAAAPGAHPDRERTHTVNAPCHSDVSKQVAVYCIVITVFRFKVGTLGAPEVSRMGSTAWGSSPRQDGTVPWISIYFVLDVLRL